MSPRAAGIDFEPEALHAEGPFAALIAANNDNSTMYAENALRAGDRLDRYELLCPIASGGMATVWLARLRGKHGFQKLFAVKTIRAELLDDPEVQGQFREMFLDEARIASGIQHPNVAQILDLGEEHDVYFIVMEWVDGDSLAKVRKLAARKRHPIPIGPALRLVGDACAGLHAAHELRDEHGDPLGIVHRDVSPQNVLVTTGGAVKVIDFGIAKSHNRRQGETRTGVVKGKLQYMAPEQIKKGPAVDRRADVWALGVCLHELVAGRLPNETDDDVEVIRKLLADEPPQVAPGLASPVAHIIGRSVALDPDRRFATAGLMQRAIEDAMKELGAGATGEDVATFLQGALPELAERRRAFVVQAVGHERARGVRKRGGREEVRDAPIDGRGETEGGPEGREEVAFAPTIISDASWSSGRESSSAAGSASSHRGSSAALDVRGGARTRRPRAEDPRASHGGPEPIEADADRLEAGDGEPMRIPKTRHLGAWIAAAVVVAGVSAVVRWSPGRTTAAVPIDADVPATSPSKGPPRDSLQNDRSGAIAPRPGHAAPGARYGEVWSGERAFAPRPGLAGTSGRSFVDSTDPRAGAAPSALAGNTGAVRWFGPSASANVVPFPADSADASAPWRADDAAAPKGSALQPPALSVGVDASAAAAVLQEESLNPYDGSGDGGPVPGNSTLTPAEADGPAPSEE